jgi:DNA-binding CsgD family transcriptional regulator
MVWGQAMKTRSPLSETERERAKVLHAGGKTPSAIAQSMGRSHHTLAKFLNKPEVRGQVSIQRQELAGMFDSVAHRIVDNVSDTDIEKANLVQKMTSAGIAVDKAAMLRGEMPMTLNLTAVVDAVEVIRKHHEAEHLNDWREAHARIVTAKDCIVANCPVHSPERALAAPAPES